MNAVKNICTVRSRWRTRLNRQNHHCGEQSRFFKKHDLLVRARIAGEARKPHGYPQAAKLKQYVELAFLRFASLLWLAGIAVLQSSGNPTLLHSESSIQVLR
jgi:hypothetical protein